MPSSWQRTPTARTADNIWAAVSYQQPINQKGPQPLTSSADPAGRVTELGLLSLSGAELFSTQLQPGKGTHGFGERPHCGRRCFLPGKR